MQIVYRVDKEVRYIFDSPPCCCADVDQSVLARLRSRQLSVAPLEFDLTQLQAAIKHLSSVTPDFEKHIFRECSSADASVMKRSDESRSVRSNSCHLKFLAWRESSSRHPCETRSFCPMTNMIPVSNAKRYDRQIRIWGPHGQARLEKSSVALLNCGPTGSETLKNLVLGGIGSFTIVDGHRVTSTDIGNNFFVHHSNLGEVGLDDTLEMLAHHACFVATAAASAPAW